MFSVKPRPQALFVAAGCSSCRMSEPGAADLASEPDLVDGDEWVEDPSFDGAVAAAAAVVVVVVVVVEVAPSAVSMPKLERD